MNTTYNGASRDPNDQDVRRCLLPSSANGVWADRDDEKKGEEVPQNVIPLRQRVPPPIRKAISILNLHVLILRRWKEKCPSCWGLDVSLEPISADK